MMTVAAYSLSELHKRDDLIRDLVAALELVNKGFASGHLPDQTIIDTKSNAKTAKMIALSTIIRAVIERAKKEA